MNRNEIVKAAAKAIATSAVVVVVGAGCGKMECDTYENCPHDAPYCVDNACAVNEPFGGGEGEGAGIAGEGEGVESNDTGFIPPSQCTTPGGVNYAMPKPNVMFLVDRSGSMANPAECATAQCPRKWDQLVNLGGYLQVVKPMARFGLTMFPAVGGADGCDVAGAPTIGLTEADDIDAQIVGVVSTTEPGGRTPMAQALAEVATSGGLDDPDRDNVLVLLTDGQPNCMCVNDQSCEDEQAIAAVDDLRARPVPIVLDVIGFSASATAAGETLSQMAIHAGTQREGTPSYFQADTIDDLIARLTEISAGLAPCRFYLDDVPAPENLVVHFDDGTVEPCTDAAGSCDFGYTYDQGAGIVEMHGSTCSDLRDGQCHDVWFQNTAQ